jgi:hypothetical protein
MFGMNEFIYLLDSSGRVWMRSWYTSEWRELELPMVDKVTMKITPTPQVKKE